jgi:hypothetical protein
VRSVEDGELVSIFGMRSGAREADGLGSGSDATGTVEAGERAAVEEVEGRPSMRLTLTIEEEAAYSKEGGGASGARGR